MTNNNSGYHYCPCPTCFEIAIGCDDDNTPHLCSDCGDAGCDPGYYTECQCLDVHETTEANSVALRSLTEE